MFLPGLIFHTNLVMSRKALYSISLLWLSLPTVIFLLTWSNLWVGIPLSMGIIGVLWSLCAKIQGTLPPMSGSGWKVVFISLVIALWITVDGIGGFLWQNEWDHDFRNALFTDLFRYSWPVVNGDEMMVYYLGFWLPAAGVAKLTGSIAIGWAMQWIWGYVGMMCAVWIAFDYLGKISLTYIFLLLFAGSIDIIPAFLRYGSEYQSGGFLALADGVIENWGGIAFIEWPDVMIFWVYNQLIPSLLACMLIFKCKDVSVTLFSMAMLLLCAPLSELLLLPVALWQLYNTLRLQKGVSAILRKVFTSSNIVSLLLLIVVGTYITSNNAAGSAGLNRMLFTHSAEQTFYWKLLVSVIIFSILPWILFSWGRLMREPVFILMACIYIPCMFIQLGDGADFISRTILPLQFFILLQLTQTVAEKKPRVSGLCKSAFGLCLLLSAVTPVLDICRTVWHSVASPQEEWRRHALPSIFAPSEAHDNFTGEADKWIFVRRNHQKEVNSQIPSGEVTTPNIGQYEGED